MIKIGVTGLLSSGKTTVSKILSKIYTKVSISIIGNKDDLNDLIKKKPDLVFSGVKYFKMSAKEYIKL